MLYPETGNDIGGRVLIRNFNRMSSDPSAFVREGIMQNDSFAIINVKF